MPAQNACMQGGVCVHDLHVYIIAKMQDGIARRVIVTLHTT